MRVVKQTHRSPFFPARAGSFRQITHSSSPGGQPLSTIGLFGALRTPRFHFSDRKREQTAGLPPDVACAGATLSASRLLAFELYSVRESPRIMGSVCVSS
jgi:hypothetical protein